MADIAEVLQLKLVLIGAVNVGKSCLTMRLKGHKGALLPTRPTPFADTTSVHYADDDTDSEFPRTVVHIFDTAGQQERFNSVTRSTYRGAKIAFLVFAVDDRRSFDTVESWYEKVKPDLDPHCVVILVGNKCDRGNEDRTITVAEADAKSRALGIPYFETSARDVTNVRETLQYAVREAVKRARALAPSKPLRQPQVVRPAAPLEDPEHAKKKKCC